MTAFPEAKGRNARWLALAAGVVDLAALIWSSFKGSLIGAAVSIGIAVLLITLTALLAHRLRNPRPMDGQVLVRTIEWVCASSIVLVVMSVFFDWPLPLRPRQPTPVAVVNPEGSPLASVIDAGPTIDVSGRDLTPVVNVAASDVAVAPELVEPDAAAAPDVRRARHTCAYVIIANDAKLPHTERMDAADQKQAKASCEARCLDSPNVNKNCRLTH